MNFKGLKGRAAATAPGGFEHLESLAVAVPPVLTGIKPVVHATPALQPTRSPEKKRIQIREFLRFHSRDPSMLQSIAGAFAQLLGGSWVRLRLIALQLWLICASPSEVGKMLMMPRCVSHSQGAEEVVMKVMHLEVIVVWPTRCAENMGLGFRVN